MILGIMQVLEVHGVVYYLHFRTLALKCLVS